MGSTYGTLETQMLRPLGNRDDDDTKAMLMAAFNWYQNILCAISDWDELETTTTKLLTEGDYDYSIVTDWSITDLRKIYTMKIHDGTRFYQPLDYVTPARWDQEFAPSIHYGNRKPTHYTVRANTVYFGQAQEASLTLYLWYQKYPTAVTDTNSVIDFPSRLDSILMSFSIGTVWLSLEEQELSDKWFALGSKFLKDLGMDDRVIPMFKTFGSTRSTISDYWKDPFVKEAL